MYGILGGGGMKMSSRKPDKIVCPRCGKENTKKNLYDSHSDLYRFYGVIPTCKDCIVEMYRNLYDRHEDDIESLYKLCRMLDIPFNRSALQAAQSVVLSRGWMLHQAYITQINSFGKGNNYGSSFDDSESFTLMMDELDDNKSKTIPDHLILKWGDNYSHIQIVQLENFYEDMMSSHDITLPQHKKLLITMCKMNLKMDECLENDDLNNFTKLHGQYQKLLESTGFRPIDNKGASESSGIRTFAQIFEEVEKDGFINPVSVTEHQDIVDKTIQYEMNYMLKLLQQQPLTEPPIDTPKIDGAQVDDVDG